MRFERTIIPLKYVIENIQLIDMRCFAQNLQKTSIDGQYLQ